MFLKSFIEDPPNLIDNFSTNFEYFANLLISLLVNFFADLKGLILL